MKRRIVLLGPPASGKGTQAELIEARFVIPVTSPGAMLREEKRKGTKLGLEADELTSQGNLLPDEIVVGLVRAWLERRNGEFVFDGFPRSLGQADALQALMEERQTQVDVVIALEADIGTIQRRVAGRLLCSACGIIVSAGLHVQSAADPCPRCGGTLIRRTDDTPETLVNRMRQYEEKTAPLIEYYEKRNLLQRVDSTRVPGEVFASIAEILERP